MNSKNISTETQSDALKVAKSIQKPNQTKEQTKLIAQGIEKGIAEYKKQQKHKAREQDKLRKKQLKQKDTADTQQKSNGISTSQQSATGYKISLALSWTAFIIYALSQHY